MKKGPKHIYIYTLSHPVTNEVYYVGRTKSPERRSREHAGYAFPYDGNRLKATNFAIRVATGLSPVFTVVEQVEHKHARVREGYWIQTLLKSCSLVNYSLGVVVL